MIFSDLSVTLVTVGLVLLFLTGMIEIWHIYVAMVLRAIGQAFQWPALGASIAMIVPEKDLSRATGFNQTLNGIINIAAPPAGAFLMNALPMQWVLSVDIITAVIAVGCLLPLMIPQPPRTTLAGQSQLLWRYEAGLQLCLDAAGTGHADRHDGITHVLCSAGVQSYSGTGE